LRVLTPGFIHFLFNYSCFALFSQGNGGYNDNRTPRPHYVKPANSSLNRDNAVPMAPGKTKTKVKAHR
jgi:hypothetical protein